MELFGFLKREEKDMFKRLISVSGVGAKMALAVLGSMPLSDLRLAILTGDAAALSRAKGVGKKTAQRLSLELKEAGYLEPVDIPGADFKFNLKCIGIFRKFFCKDSVNFFISRIFWISKYSTYS